MNKYQVIYIPNSEEGWQNIVDGLDPDQTVEAETPRAALNEVWKKFLRHQKIEASVDDVCHNDYDPKYDPKIGYELTSSITKFQDAPAHGGLLFSCYVIKL